MAAGLEVATIEGGLDKVEGEIDLIIANEHTLEYILTGRDLPGGRIWEQLAQRRRKKSQPQLP